MRCKILIGQSKKIVDKKFTMACVFCLMATFGCAGHVYSQPAKTIRLPSGIDVYDLSGEWDALTESHDQPVSHGINLQIIRITLTGSFCPLTGQITSPTKIIGYKVISNTPSQESGQAGREVFRGELEGNTFEKLEIISDGGEATPCKGKILENGNKITIESPSQGRWTLTNK